MAKERTTKLAHISKYRDLRMDRQELDTSPRRCASCGASTKPWDYIIATKSGTAYRWRLCRRHRMVIARFLENARLVDYTHSPLANPHRGN